MCYADSVHVAVTDAVLHEFLVRRLLLHLNLVSEASALLNCFKTAESKQSVTIKAESETRRWRCGGHHTILLLAPITTLKILYRYVT